MKIAISLVILLIALAFPTLFAAQVTTAFNFQGRLNDGSSPANGQYDLQFKLFDAVVGGSQIGSTLNRPNLTLVNGVFSTTLDFGSAAFAGGDRFLEIGVRPFNSPNAYVVLGARQQIMSVPFAVRSATATHADNATNSVTAQNALSLGGQPASSYARLNFSNPGFLSIEGSLSAANVSASQDLFVSRNLSLNGDTRQVAASHGFVKAMIAITASGAIARCYNGSSGSSTVPCDFAVQRIQTGRYFVDFPFSVSNRFWIVTSDDSTGSFGVHSSSVQPDGISPNRLQIRRFFDGSVTDLPFHVFVF